MKDILGNKQDSDCDDFGEMDCSAGAFAWTGMTFCHALRNLFLFVLMMYFWAWTSGNRSMKIDVLNQMCRDNMLNITFHSDSL